MAKASKKKISLADLEEVPQEALNIRDRRRELAAKKAGLIKNRDALKEQMVELRHEKIELKKEHEQRIAEATKKMADLDPEEATAEVLKSDLKPLRLDSVGSQLEEVELHIVGFNKQITELDKEDRKLVKEHGQVMTKYERQVMEAAWNEMLHYIEKAAPLHQRFLGALGRFQQGNKEFGNGTYTQALLQDGVDPFLVDFIGNKLGEFARKDVFHTLRELTMYRHEANPYHIERAVQGSGISGFDSIGR